ncbi:MAG TPA: hypothetical protein VFL12_00270, partial [Thermoanaerobaculia bacterium]|nr:hypothetical protein [Thermoanaerobaculia bacterium]
LGASAWTWRREGSAGGRLERTETWSSFTPGSSPTLRWTYAVRAPGAPDASGEIASPPVAVVSVLPGGKTPSAAPLRFPTTRPFVPWQVVAAILLAGIVASLFAVFLRRRRAVSSRVRDADEIFDGELDLLQSALGRAEPEDSFYDWLAEITRWYLEQKLGIPATRLTSDEIRGRLRAGGGPADDVAEVFSVCDGTRFARREHHRERARSAIDAARRAAASIRAAARENEPERRTA